MKQKALLTVLVAIFFLSGGVARADNMPPSMAESSGSKPAAMIASTNVFEAKIEKQEGNSLLVSFDLNNREGVQTGIHYGIDLVGHSPDGRTYLYDERVYPEMLTLGIDQTEHRSVSYEIPAPTNGKFQVWVMAKNDAGLALGLGLAGEVEVTAREGVSIQTTSCLANASGEEKQYVLSDGVDVGASDRIQVRCTVQNMSDKSISTSLNLREFRRNVFSGGDGTEVQGTNVSFGPKEEKKISFDIPVNREAQAYDVLAYFSDASGLKISNSIPIHYVSQGKSATLSNTILDKSSYAKGDTALVTLFITPSADRFNDSRGKGSVLGKLSANVRLEDISSGSMCSEEVSVDVDTDRGGIVTKEIPIAWDCPYPKVSLSLMGDGNLLDAKSYALQSDSPTNQSKNKKSAIFVLLALILFVIFAVGLWRVKMRKGVAIFFAFFFGQFFFLAHSASADSFTVYGGPFKEANGTWGNMPDVTYTVGPNKRVYAPGETVTVDGIGYIGNCVNGNFYGFLSLSFPTAGTPYLISIQNGQWGGAGWYYGSTSFPAPSVPGRYWINFTGNSLYYFQAQYSLFIDVVQPACTPSCSAAPNYCSGTPFSDGCTGTCWGTKYCPPACTPSCSAAPNYCSGTPFSDGCTGTCWGTKNCSPPPPTSPTLNLTVKGNANGVTTSNGGAITIPNGTSATLSWTTTNATSCVATSPSGVNWNPTNATSSPGVSTGNLATGSYVYSLRCNGSSGTVPITQTVSVNVGAPLADPTLSYVCNPAGNSVTLSWNAIPTATHYALRVDDLTNSPSWSGTCSSVNVGDTCNDSVMTTTFTRPVTPNQDYDAWIHACPAVGSCSLGKHIAPTPFKCVPTPVTVSGRIYNQTTGIGYGAASGVKIAACGSNPGTVVNADGTYSFQVPVGPAFCIRLTDASGNPFVPAGASGLPKTVFTDPVRSWVSSYEHQVGGQDCTTGSHCGDPVTSPDDGPSLWDRAVDTGYDFVYTSIPATVDLKANGGDSLTIQNNSPVTLTWSTSNVIAGSCSASGEWSGAKAENNASGESRGNLSTGAHTFVLTCREQGTNAPRSDTVQVTSINPPCTPNGCEANTCIPKTCNNGCGVLVPGTKDCREHWQEVAP